MFAWVGAQLDAILDTYVLGVVSASTAAITPLALTAMTTWVTLYGWAILRNEVSETLPVFMWKVFKIGLVFAFALQSAFDLSNVADTANALAMGAASTSSPLSGVDPGGGHVAVRPPRQVQRRRQHAGGRHHEGSGSMFRLDLRGGPGDSAGPRSPSCASRCSSSRRRSSSSPAFATAVGPLFVLCLAWRPTQRFFDSGPFHGSYVVVRTWFAFFALGLSPRSWASRCSKAIQDGGGFLGATFNVLGQVTRYCVLMILMAIICFQAPALRPRSPGCCHPARRPDGPERADGRRPAVGGDPRWRLYCPRRRPSPSPVAGPDRFQRRSPT